jgi:hypothetical protein
LNNGGSEEIEEKEKGKRRGSLGKVEAFAAGYPTKGRLWWWGVGPN